jgi:alkanesulfonate monooxygenase SsuD/methylene tetrahydromethanopterin reductase-like flavin-dependent oxidoreductase (luciferase family)
LVRLADALGVRYAWFAEHHAHAHHGHLPTPLLLALHLAGQTQRIHLGSAVVCLNLHTALDVAEQVAVADTLMGGRLAAGFGSGSTPEECALFHVPMRGDAERHVGFAAALQAMRRAWGTAECVEAGSSAPMAGILPRAEASLAQRCWVAVNSAGAPEIAGRLGFNMMFSHLRTPEQYRQYRQAYQAAGGKGQVAATRPVFVGVDDAAAFAQAEGALRTLWRRFQREGKIAAERAEPSRAADLCGHPINFIVGGPESVARQLRALHEQVPFDVANLEFRWAGLSHEQVLGSLERLMKEVAPRLANLSH